MNYTSILGIDVSSKKLDICLIKDNQLDNPWYISILYDEKSLKEFLQSNTDISPEHCLIGLESTGDYHLLATRIFLQAGFTVRVLNPILTKQYTRATIRGTKTDKSDSWIIAKLVIEGNGDKVDLKKLLDNRKEMLRLSAFLTKVKSALSQRLSSSQRKSVNLSKTIESKLKHIQDELEAVEDLIVKEATTSQTDQEALIDSIPGFAEKLSAIVSVELGDVSRFKNGKSIIAFAGLDPRIKQSGAKLDTQGRLTKRGSPYLRTALFLAANIARQHDKELKDYHDKKKAEGRSYKEIMCMISRKLLARIYAVLKEQKPYQKTLN